MLNPPSSAATDSPAQSAMTAAKAIRRAGGIGIPRTIASTREMTSRWISFVPS